MSEHAMAVLIVDDDDVVRESLVCHFEDRGWRVIPAVTAEEALDIITRDEPNGVIVDIRLPGMDGNALIRVLSETHPNLACVICTGSPEYHPPNDVASLHLLSKQVFAKPVANLTALEQALHQQIQKCSEGNHDDD
jgi:DNA-binding NtrC family response regulator